MSKTKIAKSGRATLQGLLAGAVGSLVQRRVRNRPTALTAGVLGVVLGLTLVLASGGMPFATDHAPSASPVPPAPPPGPITLSKEYIYAGGRLVAIEEPLLPNSPPSVTISAPAAGSTFVAPATIAISANAADSDGTVSKVDFYQGTTLIGTDTTTPFSFNWTSVGAGGYSLTATATDDRGGTTTSAAVAVTVNNPNPAVNITSPAAGTIFNAPATFAISATASVAVGTITKVDFYQATTLIGTDTSAPYNFNWSNVGAGTYSLTAKATASTGMVATSAAVSITVNSLPTVSITAPAAGSVFTAPASVTINASAADSDGTVSKVDFFQGTTLIGTDTTAPFSFNWTNVAGGSYSLTAKATDNHGATTTSAAVGITVNNPAPMVSITAPAAGSVFVAAATITINATASVSVGTITKVDFYQGTTLIGTDTSAPFSFNWSNVAAGSYSLTAKATASTGTEATSAAISVTVNNPAPMVSITAPAAGSVFTAPATIAISATASVSVGTITKVDFYQGTTLIGTDTSAPFSFNWSSVAAGGYSLTAKATASTGTVATSAAVSVTVNNPAPMVSITIPSSGATFSSPANIAIGATASVAVGTITKVEFFNGATLIGTATSSPFTFNWTNVPQGVYSLTAKATASTGTVATSAAVAVTVSNAPSVFIIMPANGIQYIAPAFIAIAANASDSDGTISKVDFYQGTTLLGTSTTSPYFFSWTSVPAGSYSLTAKATDNMGVTTTSTPVNVTVNNPLPEVSMTLPVSGATYTTPAAIAMGATASVMVGTITKVEFFQGATLLGTDTSSPYTFQWNLPPAGSYSLTAKATASTGTTRTSAPVNVTVNAGTGALRDSLKGIEGMELISEVGGHSADDSGGNRNTYYATGESRIDSYVRATITKLEDTNGTVGLVLRSSPSSQDHYFANYDAGSGGWKIYSSYEGVVTELGAWEDPLATGDARTVMFQAIGDSLTLFVEDLSRISVRDSQISAAGRAGITPSATQTTGFSVSNFEAGPAAAQQTSFGDRVFGAAQTLFRIFSCTWRV